MEKLPNGIRRAQTFTINRTTIYEKKRLKSNSLDLLEIKLLNKFLNRTELIERNLIVNTLLALPIYTIRSNSIKWFNMDKSHKLRLRQSLIKYGQVYYDNSLHYLQLILSSLSNPSTKRRIQTHQFNVELSIVVSELLNKVSIYEFNNLNNSFIFSKGLISIFEDLLLNVYDRNLGSSDTLSYDVKMMLMFLNFASKSVNFVKYSHEILYEYQEMLFTLQEYLDNSHDRNYGTSMRFSFNHLKAYTKDLIMLFENNDSKAIHENSNLLYRLLRSWLSNLPPSVALLDYLDNPIEFIIMRLYKTLGCMLNNIFPQVNFIFLSNFKGNFQLFHDPYYGARKFNWKKKHSKLVAIDNYCIRATTFFLKRYNVLSIYYNYLIFGHELYRFSYNDILTNSVIQRSMNEIKMTRFSDRYIRHYHYMHIPHEVTFEDFIPNSQSSCNEVMDPDKEYQLDYGKLESLRLFDHNQFHEHIIKTKFIKYIESQAALVQDPLDSEQDNEMMEDNDPIFNFSLANFGGDLSVISRTQSRSQSLSGSLSTTPKNSGSPGDAFSNSYIDKHKSQSHDKIVNSEVESKFNYGLFSNIIDERQFRYKLNNHYYNYLTNNEKPLTTVKIDYDRGLDVYDFDVKDYLNNPNHQFVLMDQQILKHFNIHNFLVQFNQLKNHLINHDFDLEDENDLTSKFYDDLNDGYFV